MSGVRTPSFRLSRTITRTVPPRRRNARSCSSAQICALDRHVSSRTDFARAAQRQDEEPRAPVLARAAVADHRALAVVDLAFFAGRRRDDDARLRPARCRAASRRSGGHSRTARESRGRRRGPARWRRRCGRAPRASAMSSRYGSQALALGARPGVGRPGSVDTSAAKWPVLRPEVGGHLLRNGRFCFRFARPAAAAHRDAGGFQIAADRLAPDAGGLLDAPKRPAQSPERAGFAAVCRRPRRCSSRRGTTRPSPASTSRPASVNCRF